MMQQFGPLLCTVSIWALQAIIEITFHEAAHGSVAFRFGDDTALRPRRRHVPSAKAHRPDEDYFSPGVAASPTFVVFVRLACRLGAAQPLGRKLIVGVELCAPITSLGPVGNATDGPINVLFNPHPAIAPSARSPLGKPVEACGR
jgi:hypothetical protein